MGKNTASHIAAVKPWIKPAVITADAHVVLATECTSSGGRCLFSNQKRENLPDPRIMNLTPKGGGLRYDLGEMLFVH